MALMVEESMEQSLGSLVCLKIFCSWEGGRGGGREGVGRERWRGGRGGGEGEVEGRERMGEMQERGRLY